MTFTEFRQNEHLRSWVESVLNTTEWKTLHAIILSEQHPMHWVSEGNEDSASRQLGRIEGFNHALGVLTKAARRPATDVLHKPLEPQPKKSHARNR